MIRTDRVYPRGTALLTTIVLACACSMAPAFADDAKPAEKKSADAPAASGAAAAAPAPAAAAQAPAAEAPAPPAKSADKGGAAAKSETVIDMLNKGDYAKVHSQFSSKLSG